MLEKQTEELINQVTQKPERLCVISLHCLRGGLQFVYEREYVWYCAFPGWSNGILLF